MRLLTRADFDGLACGTLLKELQLVDSWKFVHPKDMQERLVAVTDDDILTNVPYVPGCKMWFDHHASEKDRVGYDSIQVEGISAPAPSAARLIYNYYNGDETLSRFKEMLEVVDRVDSGNLTREEIMNPTGWILLGFIMDPRTGLGRFRGFTISNHKYMETLMDHCRTKTIEEILDLPDTKERIEIYYQQTEQFKTMIEKHTRVDKNVIITDLRDVEVIYTGNRFLIYSMYPQQNISVWVVDGRSKLNCSIAVGHSILNRTSNTNVGAMLLEYDGGGHEKVGTCQVNYAISDEVIADLIKRIKKDG